MCVYWYVFSPLGIQEALLPTEAEVGAAVPFLVRFWVIEPICRAMWTVGEELVAVDDAQRAQVAGMVTPVFGLDALLNPAAVPDMNGATDAQLGQYGVRRRGSGSSFWAGTWRFTLSGSTQGFSHI